MNLFSSIAESVAALLPSRPESTTLGLAGAGAKSTFPSASATGLAQWINPPASAVNYAAIDAMSSSIVMAAVNSVTRVFPEARLRVMRRTEDGSEEVPNHELPALLANPNPFMSSDELWQSTLCDYNIHGNAYWLKVRAANGRRVVEVYPLPAALVRARWPRDGSEFVSYYEVTTPTGKMRIDARDVVHFRNGLDWSAGSDGRYGLSPLASVRREVGIDEEAGNYAAALLRNVGVVGAVFTPKEQLKLDEGDRAAFRAAYQAAYGGDNRGKPMIFEVPMDVSKIAFSVDDMRTDQLRQICEERITALLNVPAIVAGLGAGLSRSTYSNMEEAYRQLWQANIIPTQRALTARLDSALLSEFPGAERLFTDFDRSQVEALNESRELAEARAREAWTAMAITLNEARARLGYEPDPAGDVYADGRKFGEAATTATDSVTALMAARQRRQLAPMPAADEGAIDATGAVS